LAGSYSLYWDGVKKELENFFSPRDMHMWIDRIEFENYDPGTNSMSLTVPSAFIKDNVLKFKDTIEETLAKISGYSCTVDFSIKSPLDKPQTVKIAASTIEKEKTTTDAGNTGSKTETEKSSMKKTVNEPAMQPHTLKHIMMAKEQVDDFTFDTFVVGNSNKFAAEVAKIVATNPGQVYNPYFVWGDSGIGKTHLLKSIERYTRENFPAKKVRYVTSEEFLNDFVNTVIRNKTPEKFRIAYRSVDVLLIDDVQFFANKDSVQEELFHTFNKLADSKKQMVFSCDQPIKKVKNLEERLKSRFAQGITVDLRPPDYELKLAILENMAEDNQLIIENDAMEYICTHIIGTIRDLKGAFQDLLAYSSIMKIKNITKDTVKDRLKEKLTRKDRAPLSVDKIIHTVAEYYHLKSSDITGKKRTKSIALARQVAMYISRVETELSTTQIGTFFGDKEHATVIHAIKKIEELYSQKDSSIKSVIDDLIHTLKSE
jgi:chromosomal replication initiator protein